MLVAAEVRGGFPLRRMERLARESFQECPLFVL
jgi:hypothetical protein